MPVEGLISAAILSLSRDWLFADGATQLILHPAWVLQKQTSGFAYLFQPQKLQSGQEIFPGKVYLLLILKNVIFVVCAYLESITNYCMRKFRGIYSKILSKASTLF